jgi:hypothetical protein
MQCIGFSHSVRVVIADRHPEGLTNILCASTGFEIVASCGEGTSCIRSDSTFAHLEKRVGDTGGGAPLSRI